MPCAIINSILEFLSGLFAILAAVYWYRSANGQIPEKINMAAAPAGEYIHVDTSSLNKLAECLNKQAQNSKTDAMYAFLCAISQSMYYLVSFFCHVKILQKLFCHID